MPRSLAWLLLIIAGLVGPGNAGAADPLAPLRPGHPRLLLTDDALARAVAAAKTDPARAALHQRIVETAEAILGARALRHPDANLAEEEERYAVYDLVTCAMAFRLTQDARFAARVKRDLLTISAFPDWIPRRDLAIGEMSFAAAIGYDWLYAELTPAERATVKEGLIRHALTFADQGYARRGSWTINSGNHNQVCNAGLVCAALAVADEEPDLARRVLAGAKESMRHALAAYAPDGGYPEGPGYWTYGTTYTVITLAALESALGTDLGIAAATPGLARTIDYYEAMQSPSGLMFNYADSTDDRQNSPARAWLAERYHVPAALQETRRLLAETVTRAGAIPFDRTIQGQVINRVFALHAAWFPVAPAAGQPVPELPRDVHVRGVADLAVFRSGWDDPAALWVGFKAGENGDHHNHLDLGSFVLDADGERWAMDLGPESSRGSYDLPGYFDNQARRWAYYRANNRSHNTVTPGDALQARHVVAPIVAFGSEPARGFAVADLTLVYSDDATSLRRGVALLDRARVLVQDEYQPSRTGAPLHWRMVTPATIELGEDGRTARLTRNGHALRVELLEPAMARWRVGSTRPPREIEHQNEGTKLLAVDVAPTGATGGTRIVVLLTPVGPRWPTRAAPEIKPLADW